MLEGLDVVLKHYETVKGRVSAPGETPERRARGYGGEHRNCIASFWVATRRRAKIQPGSAKHRILEIG